MASRKIPIKITVKTTIKRTVTQRRQVQITHQPSFESHISRNIVSETMPIAINTNTSLVQRRFPTGSYSQPVEELYDALYERRKPENLQTAALYDVFISHASEDKVAFVGPLVEKLQECGIRVWYDSTEMQWGKSLREQIDNGIKRSKYAILILSKNFFAKKWPQRELDGILAKETISGATPLPIWYNISFQDVYDFSPTLAGVFSFTTEQHSIDDICKAFSLILDKESVQDGNA